MCTSGQKPGITNTAEVLPMFGPGNIFIMMIKSDVSGACLEGPVMSILLLSFMTLNILIKFN